MHFGGGELILLVGSYVRITDYRFSHALLRDWRPSHGFAVERKKRVRVCTGGERSEAIVRNVSRASP